MELRDYAEIQAYLQEAIDGVSWDDIADAFGAKFGRQESVDAACRLTFLGFAMGLEYEKNSIMPSVIRGASDGLDRLRECQRVQEGGGTDSFCKGWSVDDSRRLLKVLNHQSAR